MHRIRDLFNITSARFRCQSCNYSCNADYNGTMNIMKRAMRYMHVAGAGLTQP
ncbi:MAG: transposase [Candidatus Brockarchaeota archaeon]|nr:transposase [Candidatus Brockarchaeota archaeon]